MTEYTFRDVNTPHDPAAEQARASLITPAELAAAEPLFVTAEEQCRALGLTPFRVTFTHRSWDSVVGQVQSTETYGPATYNHAKFCENVPPRWSTVDPHGDDYIGDTEVSR